MEYLVTGAGGQLGREWTKFLSGTDCSFTAYHSGNLDITDQATVEETLQKEKPDVVINCAAYTKVDQAENEQKKAFLVNEAGIKNLVEGCKKINAKLVHYSTDYVFSGDPDDREVYPRGYTEDAEPDPVNAYGESKRAGEIVLQNSGISWLLIRVSWLCGAEGKNFVKTMIRLADEKKSLNVVNDQLGAPSFTFDVVEKTDRLLQMNKEGIYHISSSGEITWADFAKEIFKQTGQQAVVNEVPSSEFVTEAQRPGYSLLSNRKIETFGGGQIDWKAGLQTLIRQIENH